MVPLICTWLSRLKTADLLAGSSTSPKEISDLNCAGFCSQRWRTSEEEEGDGCEQREGHTAL